MKMVNGLLVAMVTVIGASSFAKDGYAEPKVGSLPVMSCDYTEPFFDIKVSARHIYRGDSSEIFQKGDIVTYRDPVTAEDGIYVKTTTILDVSINYRYITLKFDLGEPHGMRILHVDKGTKGSDGMSEKDYPMTGTSIPLDSMQHTEVSGCEFE
ncbi:hypothetical protein ACLVWU_12000 [Bdellovibrio sp. HCB290]|uniref:hypothetical protein n=1 Tax=Bdellovibrio sp. HCB290 TaxID=3394356 RepID=UPI0039B42684